MKCIKCRKDGEVLVDIHGVEFSLCMEDYKVWSGRTWIRFQSIYKEWTGKKQLSMKDRMKCVAEHDMFIISTKGVAR